MYCYIHELLCFQRYTYIRLPFVIMQKKDFLVAYWNSPSSILTELTPSSQIKGKFYLRFDRESRIIHLKEYQCLAMYPKSQIFCVSHPLHINTRRKKSCTVFIDSDVALNCALPSMHCLGGQSRPH